jgi:hypothetical protein
VKVVQFNPPLEVDFWTATSSDDEPDQQGKLYALVLDGATPFKALIGQKGGFIFPLPPTNYFLRDG